MTPVGYRRLILTRHAKSDWNIPGIADRDRPLNLRGRRAARALGDWLASRGHEPEEVLCSPALRARETWDEVQAAVLETRPELRIEPALYDATPESMLAVLRSARQQVVMMVGHNPAMASLAAMLPANLPLDPSFRSYPTAATLVVDFQLERWVDLRPGTGSVQDFVRFDGH